MDFKARQGAPGYIGACVALDYGAHDVEVRDINCKGTFTGVLVILGAIGNNTLPAEDRLDTVSGVYVTGLTFEGQWAAGILSGGANATLRNITWDGVTVVNGTPVVANLCYPRRVTTQTSWAYLCSQQVGASVKDVLFKRFRGKLPSEDQWVRDVYKYEYSEVEYHFEDWQNGTVV